MSYDDNQIEVLRKLAEEGYRVLNEVLPNGREEQSEFFEALEAAADVLTQCQISIDPSLDDEETEE